MGLADIILNISDKASKKEAEKEVLEYVADKAHTAARRKKDISANDVHFELCSYNKGKFVFGLAEYAASGTAKRIFKELPTRSSFERTAVAKKIKKLDLGLLIFRLATGIEAQEQITAFSAESDNVPGYQSYKSLAYLLCGGKTAYNPKKKGTENTQAAEYIKQFVKRKGMPLLTVNHRDYAKGFNLKYVRKSSGKELRKNVTIGAGYHIGNRPFLKELSKKLSKNEKMQYEFFRKWAGIKRVSDIDAGSLTGLAAVMTGHTMSVSKTRKYLPRLARKYKMPE